MLTDYSHTGAPTIPDLRWEFWGEHLRDIIDAPDFLPLGFHFSVLTDAGYKPMACHTVRPGAFSSTKGRQAAA